ncbi:MAG: RidA family protein [Candidatus Izemoplasmatales bacterium]|jgi:2-iminobutanoate/2-iminopropanoate deaminase|nr:RidA family protein [Candidatus Izemoplasmatales bacterium]MDD3865181.1 RidA family protein [Candidatus Izemoplasmatales bacterium]
MLKFINTQNAPAAVGPYSQAVLAGNTLYVSGQIPFVAETMTVAGPDISSQTQQSLKNIKAIIEQAGFEITDIVRCTVFMRNMNDFSTMNSEYQAFFADHKPARAAVEVSRLPKDVLVEIDAICVKC